MRRPARSDTVIALAILKIILHRDRRNTKAHFHIFLRKLSHFSPSLIMISPWNILIMELAVHFSEKDPSALEDSRMCNSASQIWPNKPFKQTSQARHPWSWGLYFPQRPMMNLCKSIIGILAQYLGRRVPIKENFSCLECKSLSWRCSQRWWSSKLWASQSRLSSRRRRRC